MRADFARSFSVSVVWIFENFLCVRCLFTGCDPTFKRNAMNALVFLLSEQTRCATKLGVFGAMCVCVCGEK